MTHNQFAADARPTATAVLDRQDQPGAIQRLPLRLNFGWTLAGNVVYAGCQWGILIVIAKIGTPAMLGQFALALAVTAPIMILANQGLRALQATDAQERFTFENYLGYRLVTSALALAVIYVLTAALKLPSVVLVVGVAKALESVSDVLYGCYQYHDRMDRTGISMIFKGILSLAAVAVFLRLTGAIGWGAAGLAVATLLVLALYDWRQVMALQAARCESAGSAHDLQSFVQAAVGSRTMFRLAALALPLGVADMLNSVATFIPRYFVQHSEGAANLGIFAAIMSLMLAGNTVVAALAQSCAARLARLHVQEGAAAFRAWLFKLMLVGACLGAGGVMISLLWGAPLLQLIYSPTYARHSDILVIAMIAAALSYFTEFAGTGLTALRSIRIQPSIRGVSAAVSCLLCVLLVPRFGILGASWAVLLTAGFQASANVWALLSASSDGKVKSASKNA